MLNRVVVLLVMLLAAALSARSEAAEEPQVSAQARSLYDRTRDRVAQIRVLLGTSDTNTAAGTGFVVGRNGLILTNYHVVADKALEPAVYRLEYVLPDGRRGELRIVAVDVVHDLALVKGSIGEAEPLAFRDSELAKGDRGFSLGYPLNQGLTVVEGTYNGRSEEQYYERIHFTGAINPGMSGGPAIDATGRVFGVNVANHRGGQLISFLVPARFARQLLSRAAAAGQGDRDFRADVGAQLRAHGAEIMGVLLKSPLRVQTLGAFDLPAKAGEFMQCGAGTERDASKSYAADNYRCYTWSSLYIDQRLYTGMVSFGHSMLRSSELGALRFAHLQETRFAPARYSGYDRRHHTRYECRDEIVAFKGTRAKMVMCVRAYRQFEGLYDVMVRFATLGSVEQALHSYLEMEGVPFPEAAEFARRYVEAIRWNR